MVKLLEMEAITYHGKYGVILRNQAKIVELLHVKNVKWPSLQEMMIEFPHFKVKMNEMHNSTSLPTQAIEEWKWLSSFFPVGFDKKSKFETYKYKVGDNENYYPWNDISQLVIWLYQGVFIDNTSSLHFYDPVASSLTFFCLFVFFNVCNTL